MIICLAFVDPQHIFEVFDLLCDEVDDSLAPLIDWFELNYIGVRRRRGNRVFITPSRFSIEIWTVFQRTIDGNSR